MEACGVGNVVNYADAGVHWAGWHAKGKVRRKEEQSQ